MKIGGVLRGLGANKGVLRRDERGEKKRHLGCTKSKLRSFEGTREKKEGI